MLGKRAFYALTGPPGCGKTTAILKIAKKLIEEGVRVEGIYTEEIREGGRRVGFAIKRIGGGEGILAHVRFSDGPRLGRYVVNIRDLEEVGVSAILYGLEKGEVIVVDEVGPMELYSKRFREAVEKLLASDKHSVLTVHYRSRDPLVLKVKKMAAENLLVLNPSNRDKIPIMVVERILEALGRR